MAWQINYKGNHGPEDAEQATSIGADALIISNHGGRQLDGCAALFLASEIKNSLLSKPISLLFDGGIRNGKDILKVRALGATMAMIGRPYLYGLEQEAKAGLSELSRSYMSNLTVQWLCAATET